MARILKSRTYGIIIALSVLGIIIAVGYVLGQAQNKREIEIEVGVEGEAVGVLFAKANKLRTSGKEAEALAIFQEILKKHPDTPRTPIILYYMGSCYRDLGQLDMAIAQYQTILAKYPSDDNHSVLHALAVAYELSKDDTNALATFRKIINRWPHTDKAAQAGYLRGHHFYIQGDYRQAIAEYAKVAQDKQSNAKAWKARAMDKMADSYSRLKQYDKAIKIMQERANKFGTDAGTLFRMGQIYYQAGKYTQAETVLTQLLKEHPKYHNASVAQKLINRIRQM